MKKFVLGEVVQNFNAKSVNQNISKEFQSVNLSTVQNIVAKHQSSPHKLKQI